MTETVNIGNIQLICAAGLMLVAAFVSWKLALGEEKRIILATVRAFVQLLAMGFLLVYVFEFQTWWMVAIIILLMSVAATQIALSRVKNKASGLVGGVFLSIFVSSMVALFIVVDGVIQPEPWYSARQIIPLAGMVLGNTMSASAVAIDRLFNGLDSRRDEIFSLIALGASPYEAAFPSIKSAVGAGMIPTLSTMAAAGIVSIPGMMSGQILAGGNPIVAAKYQIVVLMMISAATTIGIVMVCHFAYRKRFSKAGHFLKM